MKFCSLFKSLSLLLPMCWAATGGCTAPEKAGEAAIIYSSDLFQPPDDPDDHFDWATASALKDLDVKAFIFDMASPARKPADAGVTALLQAAEITGKSAPPYATGLRMTMTSADDDGLWQAPEHQGGVDLILKTLRESEKPVAMILVGSCRDFAAAFNREPDLLRSKVRAIYVNAGNGCSGEQWEWNVRMEPTSFKALMSSGLPIYWCPCVIRAFAPPPIKEITEGRACCTLYSVENQSELLSGCRKEAVNYFAYAFDKSTDDPVALLHGAERTVPPDTRYMWSTASFLHATGREIYRTEDGGYVACTLAEAREKGIAGNRTEVYRFEPVKLVFGEDSPNRLPVANLDFETDEPNMKIFRNVTPEYNEVMVSVLKQMLSEW